jgi:Sugar (and other) transporter
LDFTGCGTVALLVPVWFNSISQYTFIIHACINFLTIPVVWAFYPETKKRTLEEMDLLFASDAPWVWEAEATFARLKEESLQAATGGGKPGDLEKASGDTSQIEHAE